MTWWSCWRRAPGEVSIILAAAFAAAAGLRKASAAVRHFVWTAALAAMVGVAGGTVGGAEVELGPRGEGGAGCGRIVVNSEQAGSVLERPPWRSA